MTDRGMMKWAPYKSLVEQSEFLDKMRFDKSKKLKPTLSSDKAEEIDLILQNYHGQELKITYFHNGCRYQIKTIIKRVDIQNKCLILPQGKLKLSDLIDIENNEVL